MLPPAAGNLTLGMPNRCDLILGRWWALGRFLDLLGHWHDWAIAERHALAAAQRLGDRTAEAFARQRLGFACIRFGDYQIAHAYLEHARSICAEVGDRAGQADAHHALTVTLQFEGRHADALGHAQQALELFTAAGDRPGRAAALNPLSLTSSAEQG